MKNFSFLVTLLPTLVSAAPVAIETSRIDSLNHEDRFGIGATVSVAQRPFIGVNNQSTALPYISYRSNNFYIEGVNIGYTLGKNKNYKIDFLTTPRFYEVKPSFATGGELAGIDETKQTIFAGISTQFSLLSTTTTIQLLSDLLESDGIEAVASVSKHFMLSDKFALIPSAGLTWQNENLVDHFYGVQLNEVQVGRALYKGKSAISYNASLTVSWDISPDIEILGFVKYESLGSGITNSPIVTKEAIILSAVGMVFRY